MLQHEQLLDREFLETLSDGSLDQLRGNAMYFGRDEVLSAASIEARGLELTNQAASMARANSTSLMLRVTLSVSARP